MSVSPFQKRRLTHAKVITRAKRLVFSVQIGQPLMSRFSTLTDADGTILTENDLLATKSLLNFMTIIWHSSTEGGVHHHTLSCFLTALVNWLSVLPHGSISKNVILDSLLTALAALDGLRSGPMSNDTNKFRLWDDESIWQLAVDSARSDLIIVCQSQNSKPLLSFSDLSCYFQQPLLQASSLLLQTIVCATHWLVQRHGST